MECEKANNLLSAYVDGALSPRQRARVERHVSTCARCCEDVIELRNLKALLSDITSPEPAPEFWSCALRSATASPVVRRHRIERRIRAASAAGLTLLALLAIPKIFPSETLPLKPVHTVNVSTLVQLHANMRSVSPLAEIGSLQYARSRANVADWSDDHRLEVD